MAQTLHSQVVRRACDVLGMKELANRLHVSLATLQTWTAGGGAPPPRGFLRRVDMLRKADPTYRPLAAEPGVEAIANCASTSG